ncbi:amidohydrolase family protein [Dongia sp.]|uniref:amidohydrolase family protein n=1 Tax=Dongia sp. TaxID=1977262 RepID=UPI0035AEC8D0
MSGSMLLRSVRLTNGETVDIAIRDGRIAAIGPDLPGEPVIEGKGRLALPALVEAHGHFDKTLWGTGWPTNSAGPTLRDYIANERRILRDVKTPIADRAGKLIEQCIAKGSLHFRCHVDVDPEFGTTHVAEMLALREKYRGIISMDFVVFPQTGLLIRPGTAEIMEAALEMGVENVGGLDPCGIDLDPIRHLETVFGLAGTYDRGVDIHLHDKGELGLWQIERIAEFTRRFERQGRTVISHAYCLGQASEARLMKIAAELAETGISIMTTAPADCPAPPVAALRAAGVNVCMGSDGIRDAWSPLGTGDMLERALFLALRFDWAKDHELADAFDCVTQSGAKALGLEDYGIGVGKPANLVLIEAENVGMAIAERRADRTVIASGRVVAEGGVYLG